MNLSNSSRLVVVMMAIFAVLLAASLDAQRGGGGRGGKGGGRGGKGKGGGGRGGGRFDEARSRLNPKFTSIVPRSTRTGQADKADKAAKPEKSDEKEPNYFEKIREVEAAAKIGRPTLLYLYSAADPEKLGKFERQMLTFRAEALCCGFKAFNLLKLDVGRDPKAREEYEKKFPVFLAFDMKGKLVSEVSLRGYKSNPGKVLKSLYKAAKGYGKMPLPKFVSNYRKFINKWDQLARDKKTLSQKIDAAGGSMSKKLLKERDKIDARERKLLERERELLEAVRPAGMAEKK